MLAQDGTGLFLARLEALLETALPGYVQEGKQYLTVAIGCTGGKHRSVVLATELAGWLTDKGYRAHVAHRDVEREEGRRARRRPRPGPDPHRPAAAREEPTATWPWLTTAAPRGGSAATWACSRPATCGAAALADLTPRSELFGYRVRATWPATTWATWPWPPSPTSRGFQEAEEVPAGCWVHGHPLPATLVPVRLCGRVDGHGEGRWRSAQSGRVESVWLEPGWPAAVPACPQPSARPTWSCSAPARPSPRWSTCSSPSWPTP